MKTSAIIVKRIRSMMAQRVYVKMIMHLRKWNLNSAFYVMVQINGLMTPFVLRAAF